MFHQQTVTYRLCLREQTLTFKVRLKKWIVAALSMGPENIGLQGCKSSGLFTIHLEQ